MHNDLVLKEINKWLSELDSYILNNIYSNIPFGKMVRSELISNITQSKQAIKLSAIIEMIHLASILHDDIIDNSEVRRGKKSINKLYDNNTSIMVGDIIYSLAFNKLADFNQDIIKSISSSVVKLSLGELGDTLLKCSFNDFNQKLYLDTIYNKTASLIEATLNSSAILENLDREAYSFYGKNIGIAFQIIDDMLDIVGDGDKTRFLDLKEGVVTLPYYYLYDSLNSNDKLILESFYNNDFSSNDENWIRSKFDEHNIISNVKEYVKSLVDSAILNMDNDNLKLLAYSLIDRKF